MNASVAGPESQAAIEIEKLMTLHPKGFDLSLGRITRLLARLGDPHEAIAPAIHIAGTNGKGSCAAFCRALLEAEGKSVHVHTSPHLVNWHERFRLAGKLVADDVLADAIVRVAEANNGEHITVFEILTAVMFVLFSEHEADYCVLEVGLGGRADATNVIEKPAVSIIMPIGMDHEAYLGDTIEKIATEKGGIIKTGVPLIIGAQHYASAGETLAALADARKVATQIYGQDFFAFQEHGRMVFQDGHGLMDLSLPVLAGRHQITNAAAAIAAMRQIGLAGDAAIVDAGMANVYWPARMQHLTHGNFVALAPQGSEIWLDGGHNPDGARVVAETLAAREEAVERPLFMITGMINTKDARGYFEQFEGLVRHVFTVPVSSSDAGIDPAVLASHAMDVGLSAEPISSIASALMLLGETWNGLERAPRILIGGSLYLAGQALAENGTVPE